MIFQPSASVEDSTDVGIEDSRVQHSTSGEYVNLFILEQLFLEVFKDIMIFVR